MFSLFRYFAFVISLCRLRYFVMSPSLFRLFVFSLSSFRLFAFVFSSFRYGAFVMSPRNNEKTKWHKSATIGYRGEVENVSYNQKQEPSSTFSAPPPPPQINPTKTKTQRATHHVPEYNVPPVCRIDHFGLLIGPQNTNFVEDVDILRSVKFRSIPFIGFRGGVVHVSAN